DGAVGEDLEGLTLSEEGEKWERERERRREEERELKLDIILLFLTTTFSEPLLCCFPTCQDVALKCSHEFTIDFSIPFVFEALPPPFSIQARGLHTKAAAASAIAISPPSV
ncbi:hypothetical protein STEG23_038417, partial [Scotinomys teguina]